MAKQQNQPSQTDFFNQPEIIGDKNTEILTPLQHRDGQQHNFKQIKQDFPFGGSFGYSESRYK
jgi:hypothetical protein